MNGLTLALFIAAFWFSGLAGVSEGFETDASRTFSADDIDDRIRGGMLAQILGNLNGLPHEFKYVDQPGNLEHYTPSLPDGARTDDDTDLEWVVVTAIERSGQALLPPAQTARLWKTHINRNIWCANRYARDLMDLGLEPPHTGSSFVNPWASFNIAGQFCCESFGLMAPAMPQTAAKIGLHYTRAAIDGEPAQTTQLFAAMIATAFVESDVQHLLDAGRASVDPDSQVAAIVDRVRALHAEHPDDWRATRQAIKQRWQVYGGSFRDQNGYELNTASTIAALLYGQGDLAETIRIAINFGWDCDNNAATAATIIGVTKGRRWMDDQGWKVKDVYQNTTRDEMPLDETITRYADRVIACARIVIESHGRKTFSDGGETFYSIRVERPGVVERLRSMADQNRQRRDLHDQVLRDLLSESPADRARAVYLAICLDEVDSIRSRHSTNWAAGLTELKKHPGIVRNIFAALPETGSSLQSAARQAGLEPAPAP